MNYKIEGADQLGKLSRKLRAAGDKELSRELSKALNRATKRARAGAKFNARRIGRRGGLARILASSTMSTKNQIDTEGTTALRIVTRGRIDIGRIDKGVVRHPVFGTKKWVNQRVRPGWWSEPMRLNESETRRELAAALDDLQQKLSH